MSVEFNLNNEENILKFAKAVVEFKENLDLQLDKAQAITVELAFETSYGRVVSTFNTDDQILIHEYWMGPDGKVIFQVKSSKARYFYMEEAELVMVDIPNDMGDIERISLSELVEDCWKSAIAKIKAKGTLQDFSTACKQNKSGQQLFNSPDEIVERYEGEINRKKAVAKIINYGKY